MAIEVISLLLTKRAQETSLGAFVVLLAICVLELVVTRLALKFKLVQSILDEPVGDRLPPIVSVAAIRARELLLVSRYAIEASLARELLALRTLVVVINYVQADAAFKNVVQRLHGLRRFEVLTQRGLHGLSFQLICPLITYINLVEVENVIHFWEFFDVVGLDHL
jgi:hypothetical protein